MTDAIDNSPEPDDLRGLALRYLDRELTTDQLGALNLRLVNDAGSAKRFVQAVQFAAMVREQAQRAAGIRQELSLADHPDVSGSEVIRSLHRLEVDDPELSPVALWSDREYRAAIQRYELAKDAITVRQLASLSGYVIGRALGSKSAYGVYVVAAAVLLAVTLYLVFGGEGEIPASGVYTDQRPGAEVRAEPREGSKPSAVVATLSAEREAVWERRPGQDLYAGQRFELIAGLAEITTTLGAVAVLQAPATIELLGQDNAIRLHAGKLVGICETESSKGFLVRTPHMEITDLGTRFGVDATGRDATEVHVFEGSVEATQPAHGAYPSERLLVRTGQAVRADASNHSLVLVPSDQQRFASIDLGNQRLLRGTGQGLADGETDSNWRVVRIGADLLDEPAPMKVVSHVAMSSELAREVPGVKYLSLTEAIVPEVRDYVQTNRILYTVGTTLNLPVDFDPSRDRLVMQFQADDRLVRVRVNGQATAAPPNRHDQNDPTIYQMTIPSQHLNPGDNAIEIEVSDLIRSNNFVWGFGIAWQLTTDRRPPP